MATAEALITENIDLWTGAIKRKSGVGRGKGSSKKIELYGVKKLRELILEMAVRGLLVPQDASDEPASVLLERVAAEKAELVKEGKLKKQKKVLPVAKQEYPFDLPHGWLFSRLGDIFDFEYGDNLPKLKRSETGEYPVYGSNGVVGSHNQFCVDRPCIVIGRKGSAGALNLCSTECWVTDVAYSVIPSENFCLDFVYRHFHTLGLTNLGKGIKPGLNRNEAYKVIFSIPPILEQHRIVAKVDELMALCDQLEQQTEANISAHQTLVETLLQAIIRSDSSANSAESIELLFANFDSLFTTEDSIDQLKQTILQLAVMGKLVPQDPSDEPASVLLEKIAAEKEKLVKEKKIKKQKALPPIGDEEKPFELPFGWELVHFQEIAYEIGTGPFGTMIHKSDYMTGGIPLINPSHMIKDKVVEDVNVSVSKKKAEELSSYYLHSGDLVLARRGEVGRCAIITSREDGWLCGTGSFYVRLADVSRSFIALVFNVGTTRNFLAGKAVGTTMVNLNHGILKKLPIALPPLEEQRRIVNSTNELMALCDQLKIQLSIIQTTQLLVADAVTEQAIA